MFAEFSAGSAPRYRVGDRFAVYRSKNTTEAIESIQSESDDKFVIRFGC